MVLIHVRVVKRGQILKIGQFLENLSSDADKPQIPPLTVDSNRWQKESFEEPLDFSRHGSFCLPLLK